MKSGRTREVLDVIIRTFGNDIANIELTEEFQLVGNLLDSMAVTNLILALEDHFGFIFSDEELSIESFQTLGNLVNLVEKKIGS